MRFMLAAGLSVVLATSAFAEDKKTAAPKKVQAAADVSKVEMKTNLGTFVIELNHKLAPVTAKNFVDYVEAGFFDGTVFHRVVPGFVIQGGGFTEHKGKLNKKDTRPPIANEGKNGLKNKRYTLSMARTSDPKSATSQFFVNLVDNANLDYPAPDGHGYAVFGKVVEGTEVIDKIGAVKTTTKSGMRDVPVKLPTVEKAKVIKTASKKS